MARHACSCRHHGKGRGWRLEHCSLAAPCVHRCCRQHGALGFNGIARTEAEELANRVAALEAQVSAAAAAAAPACLLVCLLAATTCLMLPALAALPVCLETVFEFYSVCLSRSAYCGRGCQPSPQPDRHSIPAFAHPPCPLPALMARPDLLPSVAALCCPTCVAGGFGAAVCRNLRRV